MPPAKVQARVPLPSYVTDAPEDKSLSDLLLAGDVDAIWVPLPPEKFHPVNGPIVRLVPEFRTVEKVYYPKSRCYPTQHVLVLRREVWERDPSIGRRLLEAFERVNGNFSSLFETLFGGGKAELKLVESDDPLEAGLELIAGQDLQVELPSLETIDMALQKFGGALSSFSDELADLLPQLPSHVIPELMASLEHRDREQVLTAAAFPERSAEP